MSAYRPLENAISVDLTSALPVGDPGNATLELDGAQGAAFECTAATSGTGLVKVQWYKGGAFEVWQCYEYDSSGPTYTRRNANVTITLTNTKTLFIEAPGAYAVQFDLGGTSATIHARTCSDLGGFLLQRLLESGLTAVIGAGSSVGIRPETRVVDTTLVVDTNIYANGDLLADSIAVAAARANDVNALLIGLILNDKSDNTGIACKVYFLSANQSMGTINSAPNISDANADKILGFVDIAAADWVDVGGSKQVCLTKAQLPVLCKPASGTANIYIAIVNTTGTPTYGTASDLTMRTSWQDCLA